MQKVVIPRAGGYEQLRLEEHATPSPGPAEVLVRTEAAGVNYADCLVRMGVYQSAKDYVGWPITPGFEVAGQVEAVGSGVDGLRAGDEVVAVTCFGGYATHVCVPAAQVLPRPTSLSVAEAAAFPAVHLTAWWALIELAHLQAGRRVLVHSAAGGVGSALVQIAKAVGCEVTGVVGASHKVETVRELGADHVIDKSREPLWREAEARAPDGYDVVLDANGVATLEDSYAHVAAGGRLVVYGFHSMLPRGRGRPSWPKLAWDFLRTPRFEPLEMTNSNRSVLAFNLSYLFDRVDVLQGALTELFGWVDAGKLRPPKVQHFALSDVAEAHRALESGQTVGKLVLTVEPD